MKALPAVSIAVLLNDERVPKYTCHSCKNTFVSSRPNIGRRRYCQSCKLLLTKTQGRAKYAVYVAVQNSVLPELARLLCVDCGKPAEAYDHRNYEKPLEVVPVCSGCNSKRGPAA